MHDKRVPSSAGFDWLMAILTAVAVCGPLIDGWAHTHGEVDQSFVTPWHAVLYGSIALNGLVLLAAGIVGLRRGYAFRNALPAGYWVAACGVVLFVAGGAFDAWWHTMFGIESGIALLISPSHLVLAVSAMLIFSGPLLSIASQYDRNAGGWKRVGPAVISICAIAINVGFFLAYAQPIEDGFSPLTLRPATSNAIYPTLYAVDASGVLSRVSVPPKTDLETVDVAPDGKRIVYRVNRYQDLAALPPSDLYLANADGSGQMRITSSGRHDTQPAFSPDGKWIAYVSMPAESSGDFRIMLTSPNGKRSRTLLAQATTIRQLAWSPDGKSIAYGSRNGLNEEIGVLDVANAKTRWIEATAGGVTPVWTRNGILYAHEDGTIFALQGSGGAPHVLVAKSDGSPAVSRDGKHIAYLRSDLGSEQLFVSDLAGVGAHDVSQLWGLDVQDAAWGPGGRLYFVALGRRDFTTTSLGKSLAMAALILQGIVLAGAVLLLVRRFRVPLGAFALIFTAFALAMALQSDFYFYAFGALATGIVIDVAIALGRDNVRSGSGYYALGFGAPFLFTAGFLIATVHVIGNGATGWEWNLLLGAPFLAAVAGFLLAFCFESPLEAAA